jgi:glycosyltransferase involved in cell wall biosynthesis
MERVLIITYYWPPSGGSGVQRWLKFAKYLPEFGFQPVVLTVDEKYANYPVIDETLNDDVSKDVEVIRTKSREPSNAYKFFSKKKVMPHSGLLPGNKKPGFKDSFFRFIRANFFIPDSRKGWKRYALKAAEELIREKKIKCVVVTSPPHSSQLIGLALKKKFGVKWIADLRDPWTDIYFYPELKHTAIARKIDAKYERKVLEEADQVIVVSDSIKSIFAAKSANINPAKIHVLPNGYDEADFSAALETQYASDEWTISFVGTLLDQFDVESFIKAFSRLTRTRSEKVRFRLVGNMHPALESLIAREKLENHFTHINYVPHKEAINLMAQSNALFLAIPDVPNNSGILTGKLFEYLALKKSIVCIGPKNGDAAKIIESAKAGRTFNYGDKDGVFEYLDELVETWKSGRKTNLETTAAEKYSRRSLTRELSVILKSIKS